MNWSGDEVAIMVDSCAGGEWRLSRCGNFGVQLEFEQGIGECQCFVLILSLFQLMI